MATLNFVIPEPLKKRLRSESKRTGIAMAEMVRRALVQYLDREKRTRKES